MAHLTIIEPVTMVLPGTYTTIMWYTFSWKRDRIPTVAPGKLETSSAQTTLIEVILSDEASMYTTLQETTFTRTLARGPVPPTQSVRPHHEQDAEQYYGFEKKHEEDLTTLSGRGTHPSPATPTLFPVQNVTVSTKTKTLKPSFITVTHTQTHTQTHLAEIISTPTAYLDVWPQIGSVPAETDVPQQWRETFEMKAQRQQYITLGSICSVFVVGVIAVLMVGCWRCWRNGRSGRRERVVEHEGKWAWF